jgi:hypothetical protein
MRSSRSSVVLSWRCQSIVLDESIDSEDDAVLGGAIGFAAGGFVLVFLAATSGAPDGPRPPGRTPFANLDPYTAAAKETSYQRKRVALPVSLVWSSPPCSQWPPP